MTPEQREAIQAHNLPLLSDFERRCSGYDERMKHLVIFVVLFPFLALLVGLVLTGTLPRDPNPER